MAKLRADKTLQPLGKPFFMNANSAYTAKCVSCGVLIYGGWVTDNVRETRGAPMPCWARKGGRGVDQRCNPPTKTNGLRCEKCGPPPHPPPGWMGEDTGQNPTKEDILLPDVPNPEPPKPVEPAIDPNEAPKPKVVIEPGPKPVAKVVRESKVLINLGFRNLLWVGPPGCGKSFLSQELVSHMGWDREADFGESSCSRETIPSEMFGNPTANGGWTTPDFVRIYESGGIFLADEVAKLESPILSSLNKALANDSFGTPYKRHRKAKGEKPFIFLGTANSALGGSGQFVTDIKQDAASKDRFMGSTLMVDYDLDYEMKLVQGIPNGERLLQWVWDMRKAISDAKAVNYRTDRVAGTRMVWAGSLLLGAFSLNETKQRLTPDWSDDERTKLKGTI